MKSPAGRTRPAAKKRVRLDLRRAAPPPPPEDEIGSGQQSNFWKWFGVVALFHVAVLVLVLLFYRPGPVTPKPEDFMSLVPPGQVVKGTPGAQAAPKVGASTQAHTHPHVASKPKPPQPVAVQPPPPPTPSPVKPAPIQLSPSEQDDMAPPVVKPKPKTVPPKPKIKVDLNLADGPVPDKPVKPKKTAKKSPPPAAVERDDAPDSDSSSANTDGLSKSEIAAKLGQKLDAAGVSNATKIGRSGDVNGHENQFADFYGSLRDQIQNKWQIPNQNDQKALDPIVKIHVEKNGRVPPDSVVMIRSSGNPAIDDSALNAARGLGYTLQPLPDGCPPDISITLNLGN